ncbi:hypothetical protein MPSEU_000547700, partial [Mayamaea pseudoterrestris]
MARSSLRVRLVACVGAVTLLACNVEAFQSIPGPRFAPVSIQPRLGHGVSVIRPPSQATKVASRSSSLHASNASSDANAAEVPSRRQAAKKILSRAAVCVAALALVQLTFAVAPAHARKVAKVVGEHLHTGQKVANFFRGFGIPDLAVLAIISALPVVELRGAVPVGVWMGYPISTVLPVCVLGNMVPIIPLIYLLKSSSLINKLMSPILKRAEQKTKELGLGSPSKQWVSLAAFVGIPLPGTGAWTGAMGAFLLGMPT